MKFSCNIIQSTSKIGFMSTHLESHKSLSIMNLQKVDNPLVKTLDDISALGSGHFGNVMLAEVKDGSDTIRMAVKVSETCLTNTERDEMMNYLFSD